MTDKKKEKEFDLKDELIADRKVGFFNKPDDMSDLSYNTIIYIDKFNLLIGKIVSWIIVPLFLAMVYEVIARKFFLAPTMWAYDMSRFMYGGMFMLGAAYALSRGVHIRADFLYRNFKIKNQGLVDFWLYLIFYFPGLIFFLYMTTGFVLESIHGQEKGMDTAWMPLLGPIKACLWFGIVFLLIQGVSELLKSYYAMKKGKWPGDE